MRWVRLLSMPVARATSARRSGFGSAATASRTCRALRAVLLTDVALPTAGPSTGSVPGSLDERSIIVASYYPRERSTICDAHVYDKARRSRARTREGPDADAHRGRMVRGL